MSSKENHQDPKVVAKAKSILQLFLVFLLGGIGVSTYSLWHHVAINSNALTQGSFCNVSSYINCDAVALSRYSEFLGYPVAAWALVFYGALLCVGLTLFFLPKDEEDRRNPLRAHLLVLSVVGMLPTLALAALSFLSLKLVCLMCIASYVINTILAILAWRLNQSNSETITSHIIPPKSSWTMYFVTAAVFATAPIVMNGLIGAKGMDSTTLKTLLYQHFTAKPATLQTEGFPSLGNPDAKITVVEYSDFQCPYCAKAATVIPQIILGNAQNVRLISKQYPLDPTCNTGLPGRGHAQACRAAKAATCVFKFKGNEAYYSMEKRLFENQATLSSNSIRDFALQEGLNPEELDECMKDQDVHNSIVKQVEEGSAAGVTGTPSIFINGRKLENGSSAEVLKAALKRYLESSL